MNRQRNRQTADRVEIALERGQVTTVLVGSVVAMGLVFLLGVVFGSRLAVADGGEQEAAEAARPSSGAEAPVLTFHDALTSMAEQAGVSAGGDSESAEKAPAAEPAATPPAPPAAETEATRAESSASAASSERAPSAPPPAPASPPRSDTAEKNSPGAPTFTVQVSSSRDEKDTERLAERLKGSGLDARVVAADIEGRGRWYRVRVGRYDSRDEAIRKQAEIQRSFDLSGLVVAEQ